ncbi:MAG: hypothetical protein U0031_15230 [Thermomicrobiales bacterium]
MQNWYAIETESALRRREWQREVERDARATEAIATPTRRSRPGLTQALAARLRGIAVPRLLLTPAMKAECRTAICL